MKRRTAVKWLLAVACSTLAVSVGWHFWPREWLLLERATLVARTDDWHLGERFNYGLDVHWLSENEILFTRFEGPQKKQRIAYRRNIQTGSERKLPELTKALDEFGGEVIDAEAVSPDGKWLLRSDRWGACLLAEIEGKRRFEYESKNDDCYRALHWAADSRHWLEVYAISGASESVWLHDMLAPKAARSLAIAGKETHFRNIERLIAPQKAVAVLPPYTEEPFSAAPVYLLAPGAGGRVLQQYRVALPAGVTHYQGEVSPRGDRIAWQITTLHRDTRPYWTRRLLPFFSHKACQTTQLWVSNLDGSEMVEIGHIVEPSFGSSFISVSCLQWLPDGKRLSFEHEDGLWTVPVD